MTKAFVVIAKLTSFALMEPTDSWTMLIFTSSFSIFLIEPIIASNEPCVSAFKTIFKIVWLPNSDSNNISKFEI